MVLGCPGAIPWSCGRCGAVQGFHNVVLAQVPILGFSRCSPRGAQNQGAPHTTPRLPARRARLTQLIVGPPGVLWEVDMVCGANISRGFA